MEWREKALRRLLRMASGEMRPRRGRNVGRQATKTPRPHSIMLQKRSTVTSAVGTVSAVEVEIQGNVRFDLLSPSGWEKASSSGSDLIGRNDIYTALTNDKCYVDCHSCG